MAINRFLIAYNSIININLFDDKHKLIKKNLFRQYKALILPVRRENHRVQCQTFQCTLDIWWDQN